MVEFGIAVKSNRLLDRVVTPVTVSQSQDLSVARNRKVEFCDVMALWDTGASGSCISQKIAAKLGLSPVDYGNVIGFGGEQKTNIYAIDIILPNQITVQTIHAAEFIDNGKFDCILGMNIITLGDFSLTNYNKKSIFSFTYPPMEIKENE